MKKKLFIIISMLLLVIPFSYGAFLNTCDVLLFNESFNYTDVFTNHDWVYSESYPAFPNTPVNTSDFVNSSFGFNLTGIAASTNVVRSIRRTLPNDVDISERVILTFNFSDISGGDPIADALILSLFDVIVGDYGITITMGTQTGGPGDNLITSVITGLDGENCVMDFNYEKPFITEFVLDLDFTRGLYSMYIKDHDTGEYDAHGCFNKLLGSSPANLTHITIAERVVQSENTETYFDDLKICEGSTTQTIGGCGYNFPVVWCDDFNYITSLFFRNDWTVLNFDNSLNIIFTPLNNELVMRNFTINEPQAVGYYEIDRFDVNYPTGEGAVVTASHDAPAFSIEFDMNLTLDISGGNDFLLNTFDYQREPCVQLIFEQFSPTQYDISYINESGQLSLINGTIQAPFTNQTNNIKISAFFGDTNKSYSFNSTSSVNNFDLIITDGVTGIVRKGNFKFNDNCRNIDSAFFVRQEDSLNVEIDNYFHYVGTDKFIDTTEDFSNPLFVNDTTSIILTTEESGDFAESVESIWSDFGLNTVRSKTLFGLLMMLLLGIFVIGAFLSMKMDINIPVILFLEFIFMLVLTFLGLLPVWIVIVVSILGAGIGALVVKQQATG